MSPESARLMVLSISRLMAVERGTSYRLGQAETESLTHATTLYSPKPFVAARFIRRRVADHLDLVTRGRR